MKMSFRCAGLSDTGIWCRIVLHIFVLWERKKHELPLFPAFVPDIYNSEKYVIMLIFTREIGWK